MGGTGEVTGGAGVFRVVVETTVGTGGAGVGRGTGVADEGASARDKVGASVIVF